MEVWGDPDEVNTGEEVVGLFMEARGRPNAPRFVPSVPVFITHSVMSAPCLFKQPT
jgi:hypothetical protein